MSFRPIGKAELDGLMPSSNPGAGIVCGIVPIGTPGGNGIGSGVICMPGCIGIISIPSCAIIG